MISTVTTTAPAITAITSSNLGAPEFLPSRGKSDFSRNMQPSELHNFRTKVCKSKLMDDNCELRQECPYSHCLTWNRRNPLLFKYRPMLCPEVKFQSVTGRLTVANNCKKGRKCGYAHTKEEQMYHPALYKTKMCRTFPNCSKIYCPFAHGKTELRFPSEVQEFSSYAGPEAQISLPNPLGVAMPFVSGFPSMQVVHSPLRMSRSGTNSVRNSEGFIMMPGTAGRTVPMETYTPIGSVLVNQAGQLVMNISGIESQDSYGMNHFPAPFPIMPSISHDSRQSSADLHYPKMRNQRCNEDSPRSTFTKRQSYAPLVETASSKVNDPITEPSTSASSDRADASL